MYDIYYKSVMLFSELPNIRQLLDKNNSDSDEDSGKCFLV